ncbi:hypothetical protein KQ306_01350 [Synechococcus sp. CS-1324]|uniref:hypothetical protein n=1 Tax=Synechococcus sp. CS-1324 TaxID=2847980 RepID=UPI000DB80E47|nr:hypothetical protein [Synechococcus sp. CS-1324]MCT0229509.1 hypothetical protein [Synechococcus sp. CS-1324]PZV04888.1 MAG: hypothetical protein DCF23_05105 [Cyanobium sp.]
MRYSLLRGWLMVTAGVAGLALLQSIVLPRWPQASAPGLARFNWPEVPLIPAKPLWPGGRTAGLARSTTYGFQLAGKAAPSATRLSLTLLEPRQWRTFQLAQATAEIPLLKLRERRLKKLGENELALGTIQKEAALQTCLTTEGNNFVTEKAFFSLSFEKPPQTNREQLERVLGLRQNRTHRCLLVSLSTARGGSDPDGKLINLWIELKPHLSEHLAMVNTLSGQPW